MRNSLSAGEDRFKNSYKNVIEMNLGLGKHGKKTINFTKITREDFTEEVTFEKVWKDMEKDDLG